MRGEFQKTWYATELYNQKHNGIRMLSNEQMNMLRKSRGSPGGKKIVGLPVYDMLMSLEYQREFFYEQLTERQYDAPDEKVPLDWEGAFL